MDVKQLRKELNKFLDYADISRTELERSADEAEETWNYDDYDQLCYDTWQDMAERGEQFAQVVRELLERVGE